MFFLCVFPTSLFPFSLDDVVPALSDPAPGSCWNPSHVARHSTPEDCFYILYGAVYDFTDYLSRHPGGDSIMIPECGTEATAAYEAARRHTTVRLQRQGSNYFVAQTCDGSEPEAGMYESCPLNSVLC